jgi:hypothetical protein
LDGFLGGGLWGLGGDEMTWQDKVRQLEEELRHARAMAVKEAAAEYGVSVGSIVFDRNGKRCKVVEIERVCGAGKPWLIANPQVKDGSFGGQRRVLFDNWTLAVT